MEGLLWGRDMQMLSTVLASRLAGKLRKEGGREDGNKWAAAASFQFFISGDGIRGTNEKFYRLSSPFGILKCEAYILFWPVRERSRSGNVPLRPDFTTEEQERSGPAKGIVIISKYSFFGRLYSLRKKKHNEERFDKALKLKSPSFLWSCFPRISCILCCRKGCFV